MNALLALGPLVSLLGACVLLLGFARWLLSPPTPPASPHPEPLASWTRAVCAVVDGGRICFDVPPDELRQMLAASWKIVDRASWARALRELLAESDEGIDAWDGVRAIRIVLAGACLEYVDEAHAWSAVRAIALDMLRTYRTFRDVAASYIVARRRWARLPLDGSRDDMTMVSCLRNVDAAVRANWFDVELTSFLRTPIGTTLANLDLVRIWVRTLPRHPSVHGGPPPIPRASCAYCRTAIDTRAARCEECGAPVHAATAR